MRARYSHRVAPLLSRPALGAEMAASFFSESFLQQVGLHAQVGIHPLQSSVLFLQSLHLAHHRGIHTAILRTPFVKTGSADAMLPAQLRHRNSAFRLAQHGHDLGFAKSALLHQNLLEHLAEKILLLNPLIRGEDYQMATAAKRSWHHFRKCAHFMGSASSSQQLEDAKVRATWTEVPRRSL